MQFTENNEPIIEIQQKAILIGLNKGQRTELPIEDSMNELVELVKAAGAEVMQVLIQNKNTIDAAFYIGKGKVEEIKEACDAQGANLVVFNDELSGSQIRNIEEVVGYKVIDRTALILDIFAIRAQSSTAKLQVELAQLKYALPRLKGLGISMSKTGAGIGTRGPGEQKLEMDRRRINDRVVELSARLNEEKKTRDVQRSKRQKGEIPVVAIVGYTNAGKSTLMNTFIDRFEAVGDDKKVFEKDMLFATLDTNHRRIDLDEHQRMILIDTVGFVSKLPHALVQAFKATLEEVTEADLLIHIIDSANENFAMQIDVTNNVLDELGVMNKPVIYCYNKVDKLSKMPIIPNDENAIYTAFTKNIGMDHLIAIIQKTLFSTHKIVSLFIPYDKGDVLSRICNVGKVIEIAHEEKGTRLRVELNTIDQNRFYHFTHSEDDHAL